jgi:hypothetical protein
MNMEVQLAKCVGKQQGQEVKESLLKVALQNECKKT